MSNQKVHTQEDDQRAVQPINLLPEAVPISAMMAMSGADPAAVAAAELSRIQVQMAFYMAMQNPRNQRQAWERVIAACKRPAFAAAATYSKPVGGSSINGPSVRLAEEILKQWGNVMVRTQVIFEDDDKRRVAVQVIDLETNTQYIKEIVTAKTVERKSVSKDREILGERQNSTGQKVYIVRATDDEMHNKEASAISKAVRNEGLRIVPADVVDDAYQTACATNRAEDKADPDLQLKKMISAYSDIRIQVKELEKYLGHKLDTISPSELADLRGKYQAIFDNETTWNQIMEAKKAADPSARAQNATEQKAEALKQKIAAEQSTPKGTGDDGKTPAESQEALPVPPPNEPDDFDAMDWDQLVKYVSDNADLRKKDDKQTLESVIKSQNKAELANFCRHLAARKAQ